MTDNEIAGVPTTMGEILEASGDAMVVVDGDGEIRHANQNVEAVFGYDPSELEGEDVELLLQESDREAHVEYRREYVADPEPRPMGQELDLFARHKSGEPIPVEVSLAPIDRDGEMLIMGTITDITERKRRERQLRESNERLEQFAYVASHDLREPLRTVSNYVTILEEDYSDVLDEEGTEIIDIAVTAAERMESMLDALLDYSRVTTRGEAFEPVDTDAVVANAVSDLEVLIDQEDGSVEWTDLPQVEGDVDQLRQVFQNLIKNALQHSTDDPVTVEIDGQLGREEARFVVADDGPGIPESAGESIFRMFKSEAQYQTSSQARGIGLAICENIVRRHGGDIWVVDDDPADGATFVFTIERSPGDSDTA